MTTSPTIPRRRHWLAAARRTAPLLVPILVGALLTPACLSTRVGVTASGDHQAHLRVSVFADKDALKAGGPFAEGVLVELYQVHKGKDVFVQRSLAGRWGVDGLPPGQYRVKVAALLDAGGHIRDPRAGRSEDTFWIKAGETGDAKIILKKTPSGLVVVAALTVVVLVIALAILLRDSDIPSPPSPGDVAGLLPDIPIPTFVDFGDIGPIYPGPDTWSDEDVPPPHVTSTYPRPGATVRPGFFRPSATFSQEIDEDDLEPDTMRVLGSKSGLVPGKTILDQGVLQFDPKVPFQDGETVTVTISADDVDNLAGKNLEHDFSWSFRVGEED